MVGMLIDRFLQLPALIGSSSYFLFGPRLTGKSTLVAQQLTGRARVIDLLHAESFANLAARPTMLGEMLALERQKVVVIDEIQKLPTLLDEVHRLSELDKELKFLLTGSSVRKLKRAGVNLLAGRALLAHLLPLVSKEIVDFQLDRYLRYGGLPAVHLSNQPRQRLHAYATLYMTAEIQNEGLVRNLPPFSRFLKVMALANSEIINFAKLASNCQVAVSTVRGYLQILEDTMLGALLPTWQASKKRKATTTAKFYFFDTGVTHTLAGTKTIDRNSHLYGKSFEQFIWMEIRAYLSYTGHVGQLTFWRSQTGYEVDFLIDEEIAIEVKSSTAVSVRDLRGLQALAQENIFQHFYLVSHDTNDRKIDFCYLLHWQTFLDRLWNGELFSGIS